MKTLCLILLITLLIASCHTPERSLLSGYLNTSNMPAQSFIIHPDKDTFLISTGGVRIHITKGSFNTDKPVTIEWKEALDFTSMLRAGLLTQNGKNILRSGGMFYFNTKENLNIKTPIEIDVPTQTVASGMQLYKGDSADGKIDWQDPKPIENIKAFGDNVLGKALFENNCTQCHSIDKAGTGPALAGVTERKSREWLYAMTHNPTGLMAVDSYLQCEKCKYGVMMQAFPGLSGEALDSVYNYIEDETERLGLTGKIQGSGCDSCVKYRAVYDSLMNIRNELYNTNNNSIDVDYHFDSTVPVHFVEDFFPKGIKPKLIDPLENRSDYYHITIDVPGWYNVDGLLETWSGGVSSKLIVKVQGEQADKQEVYLAIPSLKIFTQGGYLDNGKDIGFLETNGNIKLPQQTQAFVFAIGEKKGNFFFSQKDFITTTNQIITLTAASFSKEELDARVQQMEKNGLTIKSDTTIHFSSLKSVDEQLEKAKLKIPKDCGCPSANASKDTTSADTTSALRPTQTTVTRKN